VAFVISVIIIAALLPLAAFAEAKPSSDIGNGVYFIPDIYMPDIPWDVYAHKGFDGAFTPERAHDPHNDSHIQLDGNEAYFYGYYTGPQSDYLYYKETDTTEKTFEFSMMFSIYPASGGTERIAQRWHSLYSVGFLVNCVENDDDGTISGYYVSFEPRTDGDSIVLRMLERVNFGTLYYNSRLIMSTLVLDEMLLGDSMATYLYEIKSSHEAFTVLKDGEEIFALDLSTADAAQYPSDYTGGNDFGFYAAYVGGEIHSCNELSFAEFKNITLSTKSLVPTITDVSWNNGNGNGNGGGINQITVNGITLKSAKNYVEPNNFDTVIAKTTLAKNDPTAIYTVVERNADDSGQYEKIYGMKIALFEDCAWKVYTGKLCVDNPGGNDEVQKIS
jgi:hypothetical protein